MLLVLQGLDVRQGRRHPKNLRRRQPAQAVRVESFKAPVGAELQHDYLWRIHAALPPQGTIEVFNRSHYEDIVTVRVLEARPADVWRRRGEHVRSSSGCSSTKEPRS